MSETDKQNSQPPSFPLQLSNYGQLLSALTWLGFTRSSNSGGGSFGGRLASNAAGTPFPSGWSVSSLGSGRYTITHNLGTTNYVVTVTNVLSFSNVGAITNIGANSFEVTFYENTTGATWSATDTDFDFVVVPQN